MRIIVDADACPVKEILYQIGDAYQVDVILVTSYDHVSHQIPTNVSVHYVERGQDAADFKIVSLLRAGDLLITQDYGLASLALAKHVRVFHHSGKEYTLQNIDLLLEQRHFSAKVRRGGGKTKGPKKFTQEQKEHFKKLFEKVLQRG